MLDLKRSRGFGDGGQSPYISPHISPNISLLKPEHAFSGGCGADIVGLYITCNYLQEQQQYQL